MPVTKYGCLIWVIHNYKHLVLIGVVIAQAFLYTEVAVSKGICPLEWAYSFPQQKEGLSPCIKVRSLTTCQEPNPIATWRCSSYKAIPLITLLTVEAFKVALLTSGLHRAADGDDALNVCRPPR
jgi:hypothetical protein